MREKINKIEKVAIANAPLSKLEQQMIVKRLRDSGLTVSRVEPEDRVFQVESNTQARGVTTGDRYQIKKSLSSGTLRFGDKVVGAIDRDSRVVIYQPPQGLEFQSQKPQKRLVQERGLSFQVEIKFGSGSRSLKI